MVSLYTCYVSKLLLCYIYTLCITLLNICQAERLSNAVVLRLYEAYGGSASATVNINFKFNKVQL